MIIADNELIRQEIIEELKGYERTIEGLEKKLEEKKKAKEQAILNLLQTKMSIEQIAKIFNVSEDVVESLKTK